ncbi:MAG: hypothetical protein AXW17_10455 [Colwellia sp. Phe_37]|nr:MAG: hypothetical protein AXW17_10455 [Colwellia sp. Phe_37]
MSHFSYLEKLLDGEIVEWKALWEVTVWDKKFNAVERHKQKNINKHHYFLAKEINELVVPNGTVKLLTTNTSNKYTSEELAGDKIKSGEIIAIPWGGDAIVQYYKGKYLTSDNRIATSSDPELLSNKYLYYFLLNNLNELSSYYRGSGIKHPSMYDVLEMKIPIPCPNNPEKSLAIQAEIVRILDAFTAMTAELTAELNMRKKQYNYYRDQLLSFEDGEVEWKALGTIATFSQGIQVDVQNQFPEKLEDFVRFLRIVDFVKNDEIPRYVKNPGQRYLKEFGELVMIRYGASAAGKVFLNHSGAIANNMFKINLTTDLITTKFLHAYLSLPSIYSNLNSNGGASTMPAITFGQIGALNIPIPPLEEQSRILAILDKFDALTNSITEGLPREIELRQKQYEYYRDLLLSFPASPAGGPKSHSDEAA